MVNILIVLEKIGVPVAIFLGGAWISTTRGFLWDGFLFLGVGLVGYAILEWILWKMHMHEREYFFDSRK